MLNSSDEHGTEKYLCSKEFEPQILLAFVIVRGGTKTELNQSFSALRVSRLNLSVIKTF